MTTVTLTFRKGDVVKCPRPRTAKTPKNYIISAPCATCGQIAMLDGNRLLRPHYLPIAAESPVEEEG